MSQTDTMSLYISSVYRYPLFRITCESVNCFVIARTLVVKQTGFEGKYTLDKVVRLIQSEAVIRGRPRVYPVESLADKV